MPSLINHSYRFGEFTLDADQRVLLRQGKPLLLAPKVLETLMTLVQNSGRIIEKLELMTRVWPDTFVEESNLTYTIVQLRKTLGDDARHPRYIETIPKRGYRFIADVEEVLSDMEIVSNELERRVQTPVVESQDAANPISETLYAEQVEGIHAGIKEQQDSEVRSGVIAERRIACIAVLPFLDMSPDRDQDYFCEGLADELINSLASLPNLHVASRTSSFRFKSTTLDIREVGLRLNVDTVLEGSVRKAGSNFRITAQLVSAVDGYQLWSGKYDRRLEDIFAVQEDIAQSTVRALKVVLSSDDQHALQKVRTTSIEAYECYLRGRQLFYQMRRRSLESARQMYLRAIGMDDHFGSAYAGIADCSAFLYMDWGGLESDLVDADLASSKAVEMDPGLSQVHASRGVVLALRGQFSEAEREQVSGTAVHSVKNSGGKDRERRRARYARVPSARYLNSSGWRPQSRSLSSMSCCFSRFCHAMSESEPAHIASSRLRSAGVVTPSIAARCSTVETVEKYSAASRRSANVAWAEMPCTLDSLGVGREPDEEREHTLLRRCSPSARPEQPTIMPTSYTTSRGLTEKKSASEKRHGNPPVG